MEPIDKTRPSFQSKYSTDLILTPEVIRRASGIIINGRRYKSLFFIGCCYYYV